MAQFATADEFAGRIGLEELTAAQEARADELLERASGLVQNETRLTLEFTEADELVIRGTRENTILLPGRPVTEITSVAIGDDPIDDWYIDGGELTRVGGWGSPADEITVVYTHGYEQIPAAIKEAVLSAVTRVWVNPGGAVSERLGQAAMTYAVQGTPHGLFLTEDERRAVRRAVGLGSRSLPIR